MKCLAPPQKCVLCAVWEIVLLLEKCVKEAQWAKSSSNHDWILHFSHSTFRRSILYQFENSIGFFMYKYFFSQLWTHDLCCVQRTVGFFEESAFFIAPLFPLFPHIYSIVLATEIWANNWNSKNSLYNPLKSSFLSKSKDRKICQPRKGLLSRSYWKVSLKAWSRH